MTELMMHKAEVACALSESAADKVTSKHSEVEGYAIVKSTTHQWPLGGLRSAVPGADCLFVEQQPGRLRQRGDA